MREFRTSGSLGAPGEKSPGATRQDRSSLEEDLCQLADHRSSLKMVLCRLTKALFLLAVDVFELQKDRFSLAEGLGLLS
jgi:hypothetical protein